MKNLFYLFFLFMLFCLILYTCKENPVNNIHVDSMHVSTLLRTDSLGNILNGDSTDFCFKEQGPIMCFQFKPVYPNPVTNKFNVNFASPDTCSLFLKLSSGDTIYLLRNKCYSSYANFIFYKDSLKIPSGVHKIVLLDKWGCIYPDTPYCNNTGDVQFY